MRSRERLNSLETIMAAKKGDLRAFELVVKEHEKPVFCYIVRMVKRREDAEDLTQETFIKLYRNIKRYNPNYKFTTWLFKIATNVTYDWFRKQKRNSEVFILDDPLKKQAIEHLFASNQGYSYTKLDIEAGMRKIKPSYSSMFSLFYLKGFSYKEISKIKNIPVGTVKTYLYRARLAIREHLI